MIVIDLLTEAVSEAGAGRPWLIHWPTTAS
jgi:hypothetical protein